MLSEQPGGAWALRDQLARLDPCGCWYGLITFGTRRRFTLPVPGLVQTLAPTTGPCWLSSFGGRRPRTDVRAYRV